MADNHYDNYLEDLTLSIGKVQLEGFVSKQGIANFLNIPYARVPVRFRTAVPILISAHSRCLDVSRYGPRCPQKADGLQASIAHVFEKTSLSQTPDETNCLHLNIYAPHATTCLNATSNLPVFVWIHGGAFNIGDNSTQFGMFCICAKQTYR
jgi:carboxylesterase type B